MQIIFIYLNTSQAQITWLCIFNYIVIYMCKSKYGNYIIMVVNTANDYLGLGVVNNAGKNSYFLV